MKQPPRNVRREPSPAEADSPEPPVVGKASSGTTNRPPPSGAPKAPKRPLSERFPRVFKAVSGVKILVGVAIVASASLGVAWGAKRYMTTSPRFAIKSVQVDGAMRRTPQEIADLAGLSLGQNVFSFDLDAARLKIENDPWVDTATVTRKLPGSVFVTVVEHDPAALVAIEEKLYLASREGEVFKELDASDPVDLPVITGIDAGDVAKDREGVQKDVQRALDVAAEVDRTELAKRYPLQEVHLVEDGTVEVLVGSEGIAIHLGSMPYRGKLEQAERVFAELAKRKTEPSIVFLDNESSPDRVVVRMR
ncbi:MAG: FtsQ-type POTRA domain-containing protein [Polyangiaceae bacterium]|nr:FtsQ-type POTRA domain-containing protein [Polyangiaceae bacterium]